MVWRSISQILPKLNQEFKELLLSGGHLAMAEAGLLSSPVNLLHWHTSCLSKLCRFHMPSKGTFLPPSYRCTQKMDTAEFSLWTYFSFQWNSSEHIIQPELDGWMSPGLGKSSALRIMGSGHFCDELSQTLFHLWICSLCFSIFE